MRYFNKLRTRTIPSLYPYTIPFDVSVMFGTGSQVGSTRKVFNLTYSRNHEGVNYLDFSITIDEKRVINASSNGLQVSVPFEIDQEKMKDMKSRLESEDETDIQNITEQWTIIIGKLLFESLFRTKQMQELYDASRKAAQDKGQGIRFRLNIEPAELSDYPFEIIHDKQGYVSVQENTSITRFIPGNSGIRAELTIPLKLLIIGSNPSIEGVSGVTVDREVSAIKP